LRNIEPLSVVVLSCSGQGAEVAARLRALDVVRSVALLTAPYTRRRPTLRAKIRNAYRAEGLPGLVSALRRRLGRLRRSAREAGTLAEATLDPSIPHFHFADFHGRDCLDRLALLRPDLGLVVGTYILKEPVFGVPRLGCVNLHSGKVPEYRGSAPGFWELYNGERQVGITIHKVTATLDAGDILLQECFPIDPAPRGDPLRYLEAYRREVLWPNGVRMLVEAVTALASGTAQWRPQEHARARTYPRPDYAAVKELRRRVRARRAGGVA